MRVCKVIGHVVSTVKHEALAGQRIAVVAGLAGRSDPKVPMRLALDAVGAGIGSQVLVVESGAAGSLVTQRKHPPVRSVIVGIVDC